MLANYFKLAWRHLIRNRISSIINIGGLAVGLATAILIMLVVRNEYSYDQFHQHLRDICLVMKNEKLSGGISTGEVTPGPLAANLRTAVPEAKYISRVAYFGKQLVRVGDKSLYESGLYTEPDFFHIMSFPALQGNPVAAMQDPASVVLTERAAKRLFGNQNALGQTIVCDNRYPLKVAALVRDPPPNSTIQFDMVLPFGLYEQQNPWLTKWGDNRIQTVVRLAPGAQRPALDRKMTQLFQKWSGDSTISLFAYPFGRLRLHGGFSNGKPDGGRIELVRMLVLLAIFILLIACINFMNITTARSEYRAREVGIRKVLGSSRKRLLLQFLSEAFLLTFLALAAGILLARAVLPVFNRIMNENLAFRFEDLYAWAILLGIGLVTGLVAGSYPAFFLSRFKPVKVLKGIMANGKRGAGLRRVLVAVQFFISVLFIVATIVMYTQINFVHNRPLGYDLENLIDIQASGNLATQYETFRNELAKIPGVKEISGGNDNLLNFGGSITGMDWDGKQPGEDIPIVASWVQYDWIRTAGLKIVEGRDFSRDFGTDTTACLVNQVTVAKLGLKEPVIGKKLGGKPIIGVFRDFVYNNPSGRIAPMVIFFQKTAPSHILVRIQNDAHWRETLARIKTAARTLNPDFPFDFSFTKEDYQQRFEEWSSMGLMAAVFGGMAIFISCLGLFGLSGFLAEQRSKEMSIRKVFGADFIQVWLSLSRDFLKPVFIALVLVIPVSVWAAQSFLSHITYHISPGWWIFALAGGLAIGIAFLTVSYQGIRTALENPVKRLRAE